MFAIAFSVLVWLFLKKILFKNKSEKYKALGYFLHKII
jgi:hypothetical protein